MDVTNSFSCSLEKTASITINIRMRERLRKSADAASTPRIVPKNFGGKPEEDEDDVVSIEAVNRSNEADLVQGHLIESSDNSVTKAVAYPPVIGRLAPNRKRKIEASVQKDTQSLDIYGFPRTHQKSSKTPTPSATVQADESPPPAKTRKQFANISEEANTSRLHEEPDPSTSSGFHGNGPNRIMNNNRRKADAADVSSKSPVLIKNKKQQWKEADDDESVFPCPDNADSVPSAECPFQSIELWEEMYGPITVGKRSVNSRMNFEKDLNMECRKYLPNREFSQKLLDALYRDSKYDVTICGQSILRDLALLHYFICMPNDIKNCGEIEVFQKINFLDWEILRGLDGSTLWRRFNDYIRGYVDEFGLPKSIQDQFFYWEWFRRWER